MKQKQKTPKIRLLTYKRSVFVEDVHVHELIRGSNHGTVMFNVVTNEILREDENVSYLIYELR